MTELLILVILTLGAGLAMPLGALLASVENIHPHWLEEEFRHSAIAFGGGALLSAVALVLVPTGIAELTPLAASTCVVAGALGFMALDIYLVKLNTPASQLAAMLMDFVPESIALGAAFEMESNDALLIAGLIALQNIPEGFNAYRELKQPALMNGKTIIVIFCLMALLGPAAGVGSYLWLRDTPGVVAVIVLMASGGILYSIFQDIAPKVRLEQHWAPPLGAVLGFVMGMAGYMLAG